MNRNESDARILFYAAAVMSGVFLGAVATIIAGGL